MNRPFAGDQVVITGGVEDANQIGRKLEEYCEKWGFKINYGKMKYLGTDHSEKLHMNANIIQTVKQLSVWDQQFKRIAHLILKLKKELVKQEALLAC